MCCIHRVVCTVPSAVPLCWKLCSVPTNKSRKITWNLTISFHCKCTIATEHNLQKQHIKYIKFGLFCCLMSLFSSISAVVLILLLGACESEQFPTAEYSKSQKYNIKLCIHAFYSTRFCLHSHFPTPTYGTVGRGPRKTNTPMKIRYIKFYVSIY